VVKKHQLYPDPEEYKEKLQRQKRRTKKKKIRINKLKELGFKPQPGKLWHTDTIILWWYSQRRIIFTALEDQTKLGYARVYTSGSSRQAKDFLQRLIYLSVEILESSIQVMGVSLPESLRKLALNLVFNKSIPGLKLPRIIQP